MKAKTKVLGAALIVLALGAMMSSAAQAANNVTIAGEYPATLKGIDPEAPTISKMGAFSFGGGVRKLQCTENTATATLTGPSSKITVTPTYGKCFSNELETVPVTITMNGCSYTIEPTSTETGVTYIDCPAGKQIEQHVYENAQAHSFNGSLCTYDIGPQGPINHIIITHIKATPEHLLLHYSLTGIAATSTIGSKIVCGATAGTAIPLTVTGTVTVTATEKAGAATALMVE